MAMSENAKKAFDEMAEQPKLYAAVEHIHTGYRRSVYTSPGPTQCLGRTRPNPVCIVHGRSYRYTA